MFRISTDWKYYVFSILVVLGYAIALDYKFGLFGENLYVFTHVLILGFCKICENLYDFVYVLVGGI